MITLPPEIAESFDKYEEMQKNHMAAFDTDLAPDMENFNFERSRRFETLKNELTLLISQSKNMDDDAHEIFLICQSKISRILRQDDIIAGKIEAYRDEIASHMQKLHRGQKAIKGYAQFNS